MGSFLVTRTKTAFFQNSSSSSGAASGSSAMAFRMPASVILRRRSQSVLPADFAPVDFSFPPRRNAWRDDSSDATFFFRVDDENLFVFKEPDRSPTFFLIDKPSVDPLDHLAIENRYGVTKADAVLGEIARSLLLIPGEAHCMYGLYLHQSKSLASSARISGVSTAIWP